MLGTKINEVDENSSTYLKVKTQLNNNTTNSKSLSDDEFNNSETEWSDDGFITQDENIYLDESRYDCLSNGEGSLGSLDENNQNLTQFTKFTVLSR